MLVSFCKCGKGTTKRQQRTISSKEDDQLIIPSLMTEERKLALERAARKDTSIKKEALLVNYGERLFHNQRPLDRMNRFLDVRYRMNHTTKGLAVIQSPSLVVELLD